MSALIPLEIALSFWQDTLKVNFEVVSGRIGRGPAGQTLGVLSF